MKDDREPAILPVRPGAITAKDRAALRRVGVVVIECDRPEEIRLIRPSADIDAGTMLRCALKALAAGDSTGYVRENREQFVRLLAASISETEAP